MAELANRVAVVTVGEVQVFGLRTSFDVRRSTSKGPNNARVSIWNLSEETRRSLQRETVRTVLEAGYQDNVSQIFSGDLRQVSSRREGEDWVTRVESGDGEQAFKNARANISLKKADFAQLVKESADALGVGVGNALEKAKQGRFMQAVSELTTGVVLNGPAKDIIDRLTRSAGLEWSIQDGQLQFLELNQALEGTAVELGPDSGLVGSPEIMEDGTVMVKSLLQPDIVPGRQIRIRSRLVDGFYRCEVATYRGDTHGTEWYVEAEVRPL